MFYQLAQHHVGIITTLRSPADTVCLGLCTGPRHQSISHRYNPTCSTPPASRSAPKRPSQQTTSQTDADQSFLRSRGLSHDELVLQLVDPTLSITSPHAAGIRSQQSAAVRPLQSVHKASNPVPQHLLVTNTYTTGASFRSTHWSPRFAYLLRI